MTGGLALGIAGLAALDSLNPATLVVVTLVLLSNVRHPVLLALVFVLGAYLAVLTVGLALFLAADAAADAVAGGLVWVRRVAFGIAALTLLVSAVRRLRPRTRTAVTLPSWFSPWTALPLGVLVTGADLPNAFPYLIAIERMVAAEVPNSTGVLVLALYGVVYCVPCLALLLAGRLFGARVRARLQPLYDRFGATGEVLADRRVAAGLAVLAVAVGSVAAS